MKKEKFRKFFPFIKKTSSIYLDSAATNLKPNAVIKAIRDYYERYSINDHSGTTSEIHKKVFDVVNETRDIISKKINCKPEEIVFFPSASYCLNILSLSLKKFLKKGDKILTTKLEHSSNIFPWQSISLESLVEIVFIPLDKNFSINIESLKTMIDESTKVVTIFHVSNSLGSINDIEKISNLIKNINSDCLIIVDSCQGIAHEKIDIEKWKIDALVFSAHKLYGPTGLGVLWMSRKMNDSISEILWGGGKNNGPLSQEKNFNLSKKFEIGTQPLAEIFGFRKSLIFFSKIKIEEIKKIEEDIWNYAVKKMRENLKSLIIYNKKENSTKSIILFNLKGLHSHDIAEYLGKNKILVRAGNFCCPYLSDIINCQSSIRLSFSIYNNEKDIDELVRELSIIEKNPNRLIFL